MRATLMPAADYLAIARARPVFAHARQDDGASTFHPPGRIDQKSPDDHLSAGWIGVD